MTLVTILSGSTSLAQAPKTLTRDLEPVVRTAGELRLDKFTDPADPVPVVNLAAWRYRASGGVWTQVPFQVDQKAYKDLGAQLCQFADVSCCPNCHQCEISYVWDGENDPDDPAGSPNVLDNNDELVFMAKDTGDQAPVTSWPPGTVQQRYELRVSSDNPEQGGVGYIYIVRHPGAAPAVAPYVHYAAEGSGATEVTTIRGCDHPLLAGHDIYQMTLVGNWRLEDIKVKSAGTAAGCPSDFSAAPRLLDRFKWRMGGPTGAQTEETWNNTSGKLGVRVGPVRIVRGSIGAASGAGTTN